MPEYVLHIKVKGSDDGGNRVISGLQRGLSGIATVAGGILAANLFLRVAEGIGNLVKNSVAAASSIQELTIALETLVAREIKQTEDWAMQTSRVRTSMTKKQREELGDLTDDYGVLTARIQEQKQKIHEWTQVWTDEPALKVETARAQLQRMEHDAEKMQARITELNSIEGKWVTTTEKVQVGNMLLTDALAEAGPKAQELLKYLRDLSLVSPYQFQDVANTFRFSMALGASTDQAKEMTGATMDMAAALGLRNEQLHRLQYNLAQGIFAGDLTMVNLRQLKLVGLDLAGILEQELGMSLQEVRDQMKAGKIDSEDLAKAFSDHVDKYYAGAAERMTKTWGGLTNNLKDLMFFLGADLIGPALDVVTGSLGGLFDKAREVLESGKIAELGAVLASVLEAIMAGDIGGAFDALAGGLNLLGAPQGLIDFIDALSPFGQAIKELIDGDVDGFILNLAAGVGELLKVIGVEPEIATNISLGILDIGRAINEFALSKLESITSALTPFKEAWAQLRGGKVDEFMLTFSSALGELLGVILGLSPLAIANLSTVLLRLVSGAAGLAGAVVELGASGATAFFGWFEEHGAAVGESITGIALSVSDIVVAVGSLFLALVQDGPPAASIMESAVNTTLGEFLSILEELEEKLSGVTENIKGISEVFVGIGEAFDKLPKVKLPGWLTDLLGEDFWEEFKGGFFGRWKAGPAGDADDIAIVGDKVAGVLGAGVERALGQTTPAEKQQAMESWREGWEAAMGGAFTTAAEGAVDGAAQLFQGMPEALRPTIETAASGTGMVVSDAIVGMQIPDPLAGEPAIFGQVNDAIINWLTTSPPEQEIALAEWRKGWAEGMSQPISIGTDPGGEPAIFGQINDALIDWLTTTPPEQEEAMENWRKGWVEGMTGPLPDPSGLLGGEPAFFGDVQHWINTNLLTSPDQAEGLESWRKEWVSAMGGAFTEMNDEISPPLETTTGMVIGEWERVQRELVGDSIIPSMMTDIVGLFADLSTDLESPLGEVYTTITDKMGEILTFIEGEMPKYVAAGEDMALGIKKGIKQKWDEVKETFKIKLRGLVTSILQELGIMSPSRVMADIGENMVEGLEQGIVERWPGLEGVVIGQVSSLANWIGINLGRGLIRAAQVIAAEEERFFGSVLVDIANRLMSIGMAFSKRYEDLYLGPLQEQIDSIEQAMADAKREGHMEEYLLLEAQRNALAAEYEEIQARTLRLQKAQQSLQFLQQQVQLIELIKEYGLDAKAILQGMTLGLGASTDELVDAITKALEMIIAQTEKTLQLGSPSKLFMGFGRDIMQGLARGISSVKVEVPNPGYDDNGRGAQRINQRNVTFNQTMNVTTGATSPEVQRDWGIMTHLAPTYSR